MRGWLLAALLGLTRVVDGAVFTTQPGEDLIGAPRTAVVAREETLLDIARRHDLGYEEIVLANPGVDPWVPPAGATVQVPTQFLLPPGPRSGIVVDLTRMRLFLYALGPTGSGVVTTHPLGIGREFHLPATGQTRVVGKRANPEWIPPLSIRAERAAAGETLPPRVPPGPDNPLGSHALYLGIPALLIHGTHRPWGIGMRVSAGCLRLYPEDIESLYARVPVGTPVRIVRQPFVIGRSREGLHLQVSPRFPEDETRGGSLLNDVIRAIATQRQPDEEIDWDAVSRAVAKRSGAIVRIAPPP
jgi:L,D-transpeptidase ErfK/SrfK